MFPFQNFLVYQRAFALNKEIYTWIQAQTQLPGYLRNQLGRAALSVMLNAAEGSSRSNVRERRHLFTLARGSCFECAALLSLLTETGVLDSPLSQRWLLSFDEILRMLYAQMKKLM